MKLVEILARELKEWPPEAVAIAQDHDGCAHPYDSSDVEFNHGDWGGEGAEVMNSSYSVRIGERAEDYATAIVTRAQWQEAREALSKPGYLGAPMPPISEAPKDATHWDPGIDCTATWAMKCDGIWYWHPVFGEAIENGWRPYSNVNPDPMKFIRIDRPWLGDGLPPVGTECEFKQNLLGWVKATITAITDKSIVFTRPIYRHAEITGVHEELLPHKAIERFRPIRTPEQIAAEERTKECDKIYGILCKVEREGNRSDMAEALYDAGYRKVKDGNQEA